MNSHERMQRESNLVAIIREKLPEFVKACADDTELVLIHQDAFAADYQGRRIRASWDGDQVCWPSREGSPCDREKPKHTARRRENPVTESLQKQVAHPKPHLCSRGALKRFLGFARDFGSGLKRPLSASTWGAAFSPCWQGIGDEIAGLAERFFGQAHHGS